MSGPEVVAEVAALSASTWDNKVLNLKRLLDDNGYAMRYGMDHVGNTLTIVFTAVGPGNTVVILKEFVVDLAALTTERQVLVAIDDYFGEFEGDRSYDWEQDNGPTA